MMTRLLKGGFRAAGLDVQWRDRLAEMIPSNYHNSPFLPRLYKQTAARLFYFRDLWERVRDVEGDVVECGVSIGHGLLSFMLLGDLTGRPRRVFGFDSFEGFPDPTPQDRMANGAYKVSRGVYASGTGVVHKVLQDGRVPPEQVDHLLTLVPGFFETTLPTYDGRIAVLHLDCDLYESYRTCLTALYDKVAPGGLILFDEYEDPTFPGAKRAVDEFFAGRPEKVQTYSAYQYTKMFVVKAG